MVAVHLIRRGWLLLSFLVRCSLSAFAQGCLYFSEDILLMFSKVRFLGAVLNHFICILGSLSPHNIILFYFTKIPLGVFLIELFTVSRVKFGVNLLTRHLA